MSVDIYICDENFKRTDILEGFNSFIWTDRYTKAGEFKCTFSMDSPISSRMKIDAYLKHDKTQNHMIVESYVKDHDKGTITFAGRDLRSLFERRANWYLVWARNSQTKESVRHGINTVARDLVYLSCITSVDGFSKMTLGDDYLPWNETPSSQRDYSSKNVLEALERMCTEAEVGFQLEYHPSFTPSGKSTVYDNLIFYLRMGVDRSIRQNDRPKVIFDQKLDNISDVNEVKAAGGITTVYILDDDAQNSHIRMATAAYRLDPYRVHNRTVAYQPSDADIGGFSGGGIEQYWRYLAYKARQEGKAIHIFDGKLLPGGPFEYNWDYAMGDIVTIGEKLNQSQDARVVEYIWNMDQNGLTEYPTFEVTHDAGVIS